MEERFGYDEMNRLTGVWLGSAQTGASAYDGYGRMTSKAAGGQPVFSNAVFDNAKVHAITSAQTAAGLFPLDAQSITYTGFDKVGTIRQEGKTLTVCYGIDRQRVAQSFTDGKNTRAKRYFTPLYEKVTENGVTKKLHYLTSATGLFAIFVGTANGGTMYYTLKDHQGSLAAVVRGNTVERLSYDPWGRQRNTTDFGYDNVSHTFDRGYTLHEHYDDFDLINMKFTLSERSAKLCLSTAERCELGGANGRLYDPILGRMLSPDVVIQDEQNSQAYNRYSYCFNNPLRFTDPSGYVVRGSSSLFNGFTLFLYESPHNKGVLFNTDEALGQQLPKIEPFGEEEKKAYIAYRNTVFSYNTKEFKTIQTELIRLENAEEVFRIRMGENTTSKAGGGNFIYNKETGEFDVNIADYGDFSTMGKIAHELKHADQYITGELGFDIRGNDQFGKPIAYDIYDEYDAYNRQALFEKNSISNSIIFERYKNLNQTHISIDNIRSPYNKEQMIQLNNNDYKTKNKSIRFIYHGWQNDIK